MRKTRRKFAKGITLIELLIGVVVSLIVLFTAGLLLVSGHKNWSKTFRYAYGDIQVNALETMIAFGKTGRMSNKSDYVLYTVAGGNFTKSMPTLPYNPDEVVLGEAVEFRYWVPDLSEMDKDQQKAVMKTDVTGNTYALFYVEDGKLKVDRGPYPPGGINAGNKLAPVRTYVLAKNVQSVVFSHTTKNVAGDGNGCIKMDLALYDSKEDRGIHVKTATLMRNVWP